MKLTGTMYALSMLLFGFALEAAQPLRVTFDDKGIAVIKGGTEEQVWETLGYIAARDRMFQLFITIETLSGRLAALIGPSGIANDEFQRTINYTSQELDQQFSQLSEKTKLIYEAYTRGIQRRIQEVNADPTLLPYQVKVLGLSSIPVYTRNDILTAVFNTLLQFSGAAQITIMFQLQNLAILEGFIAQTGNVATALAMLTDLFGPIDQTNFHVKDTVLPNNVCGNSQNRGIDLNSEQNKITKRSTKFNNEDFKAKCKSANEFLIKHRALLEIRKKWNVIPKVGSFGAVIGKSKSATGHPLLLSGPQPLYNFPDAFYQISIDNNQIETHYYQFTFIPIPLFLVGVFKNFASTIETGHLPAQDFRFEPASNAVFSHNEVIHVRGGSDIILPVFRSKNKGWVLKQVNNTTILTLQDIFIGKHLKSLDFITKFTAAQTIEQMLKVVQDPTLQTDLLGFHLQTIDTADNIAAFHLGAWTDLGPTVDRRIPLGTFAPAPTVTDANIRQPLFDVNSDQGYYASWNSLYKEGLPFVTSNPFGESQRLVWITDYIKAKGFLTFEDMENLALHIGQANGFTGQGLGPDGAPEFVSDPFNDLFRDRFFEAVERMPTPERLQAINFLKDYTGAWLVGDKNTLVSTLDISDKWMLANLWELFMYHEVFGSFTVPNTLFFDFIPTPAQLFPTLPNSSLFNIRALGSSFLLLSRILETTACNNPVFFNWLQGRNPDQLIVNALDSALAVLGGFEAQPWGTGRRPIHDTKDPVLGTVHQELTFNEAGELFVATVNKCGINHLRGMTRLGQDGNVFGTPPLPPIFAVHAFDQAPYFNTYNFRDLMLFDYVQQALNQGECRPVPCPECPDCPKCPVPPVPCTNKWLNAIKDSLCKK